MGRCLYLSSISKWRNNCKIGGIKINDNIRKVFDILGVEPNEEFKIEDKNCFWKIDEKLNLYYRQGHYDNGDYAYNRFHNSLIIDLIKNPELIIKLPKKKKLRDLALEEYEKWLEKNCGNCSKCIFKLVYCDSDIFNNDYCWIYHKDLYSNAFLDQEIEVE